MRIACGGYRLTWLLALLVLACVSLPKVAYAQSVGTITQLTGTAQIERAGVTTPAAVSMPIQLHDKITTAPASQVVIGLVDNGQITLNESSTLLIDDSALVHGVAAPTKVGLIGGSLRALILGDLRTAGGGFEIHTPNAIGAIRGSDANASYVDGQPRPGYKNCTQFTDFYVNEGRLYVTNAINPNIPGQEIHTGQQLTVACGFYLGANSAGGAGGGFFATNALFIGAGLFGVTAITIPTLAATGTIGSNNSAPTPPPCTSCTK